MKRPEMQFGASVPIDAKRVEIQMTRIDACDTLLDYLHDQEPLMELLNKVKARLQDEMQVMLAEPTTMTREQKLEATLIGIKLAIQDKGGYENTIAKINSALEP